MRRLYAAGLATFWLAPIAAAVAAVGIFESYSQDAATVLATGIALGLATWLVATIVYLPAAGAKRANYRSYSLLVRRIDGLRKRRDLVCRQARNDAALVGEQVRKSLDDLCTQLRTPGVTWVLGTGYIAAWEAVHRAEEMLIEAEEKDELLEDIQRDLLRLDSSAIPQRAQLVDLAKAAKAVLCREKGRESWLDHLEAVRKAVREVRTNVNVFRDNTWNGLVVLRNQTMAALVIVELSGFALLALAILLAAQKKDDIPAHQAALGAAALFFVVGAVFGALNRLYARSQSDASVDDYGLATARLIAIPAISGLAGVGGVVFVGLTVTGTTDLSVIFDVVHHPLVLADAAAFGLAPGILVQLLDKHGQKYQDDIKSTEPTDGANAPKA
jgi:hypothetical protein